MPVSSFLIYALFYGQTVIQSYTPQMRPDSLRFYAQFGESGTKSKNQCMMLCDLTAAKARNHPLRLFRLDANEYTGGSSGQPASFS